MSQSTLPTEYKVQLSMHGFMTLMTNEEEIREHFVKWIMRQDTDFVMENSAIHIVDAYVLNEGINFDSPDTNLGFLDFTQMLCPIALKYIGLMPILAKN